MRDILPGKARRWDVVEQAITEVIRGHACEAIRLPLLEFTELFAQALVKPQISWKKKCIR